MKKIKGYKVFNPDMTCREFQYEIGKTYEMEGSIELCDRGFHFCENLNDCFNYYSFKAANKVCAVEALGEVKSGDDKSVTNKIKIGNELSWHEVLILINTGKGNTGRSNSGDWNSGDWNSGDRNSGDWNSGDWNSGDWNSGYRNSGYRNSGDRNSGDRNSGDRNSGDRNSGDRNSGDRNSGDWNSGYRNSGDWNSGYRNSGDWNSGDWNSGDFNSGSYHTGFFNTQEDPDIFIFDKPAGKRSDFVNSEAYGICSRLEVVKWEENSNNVTGGKYVPIPYKEAWVNLWESLTESEKKQVQSIPNFDTKKFEEITGIKL